MGEYLALSAFFISKVPTRAPPQLLAPDSEFLALSHEPHNPLRIKKPIEPASYLLEGKDPHRTFRTDQQIHSSFRMNWTLGLLSHIQPSRPRHAHSFGNFFILENGKLEVWIPYGRFVGVEIREWEGWNGKNTAFLHLCRFWCSIHGEEESGRMDIILAFLP